MDGGKSGEIMDMDARVGVKTEAPPPLPAPPAPPALALRKAQYSPARTPLELAS